MKNFASYHTATWKAGDSPAGEVSVGVVVEYDQTFDAYSIEPDELADFIEWVSMTFPGDNSQIDDGETVQEHLERVGITVSYV